MRRQGIASLVFIVVFAAGFLSYTLVSGNRPLLGLDLQGGVSVVLQPTEQVDDEQLEQAKEIIDRRVNALGIAEPEITRQGDTILVQIPGIDDRERALELVGQTAELRFRPVLQIQPEIDPSELPETTTTAPAGGGTTTTAPPEGATTTAPPPDGASTTAPAPETTAPESDEGALGPPVVGEGAAGPAPLAQEETPPATVAPPESPATTAAPTGTTVPAELPPDLLGGLLERTPREEDAPDATVVLPGREGEDGTVLLYQMGPTAVTGEALEGASASLSGVQWVVLPKFKGGADGIDKFNEIAAKCFAQDVTCPTGQLGIVLDGEVISAPSINEPSYQRDQIQISGDFSEGEAKDLALVLRYGALPVVLEPQQVQIVSATLGSDALDAALVSGLVGLVLAGLYMILFYRLLGLVAILSLSVSAAILFSFISLLGETRGLALSLSGITGIIVSIGVSLDSNVVYFEHLKEDVRNGRTIRSAVDRSFASAFSTIVKADTASLIGAFLLWWLTVGPVRGFAFYLGLATILDIVASWFFMRPAVRIVGRSKLVERRPGVVALPKAPTPGGSAAGDQEPVTVGAR